MRMTVAQIRSELDACDDGIRDAYWAFTRQARGKPPAMTVPHLYARRRELSDELRRRRAKRLARGV